MQLREGREAMDKRELAKEASNRVGKYANLNFLIKQFTLMNLRINSKVLRIKKYFTRRGEKMLSEIALISEA